MRRRARVDANQPDVVARFEQWGASVTHMHQLGRGAPDILIGLCGVDRQIEVKDGSKPPSERALTPDENEYHRDWRGAPVLIVETLDDVDRICEAIRQAHARSFEDAIAPRKNT